MASPAFQIADSFDDSTTPDSSTDASSTDSDTPDSSIDDVASTDSSQSNTPVPSPTADTASQGASVSDEILSDTLGIFWRAASATVDPWTKNIIEADAKAAQVKATGYGLGDSEVIPGTGQTVGELKAAGYSDSDLEMLRQNAYAQLDNGGAFYNDQGDLVTKVLTSDNADPSQFWQGVKANFLDKLNPLVPGSLGFYVALAGLGIVALVVVVKMK